jgi:hypothetical protein
MICPFCRLETGQRHLNHADCIDALKPARDDVYARVERITLLLGQLTRTARTSPRHRALAEELHVEAVAYLAAVDAGTRRQPGR